jgi:hypothetical protein
MGYEAPLGWRDYTQLGNSCVERERSGWRVGDRNKRRVQKAPLGWRDYTQLGNSCVERERSGRRVGNRNKRRVQKAPLGWRDYTQLGNSCVERERSGWRVGDHRLQAISAPPCRKRASKSQSRSSLRAKSAQDGCRRCDGWPCSPVPYWQLVRNRWSP